MNATPVFISFGFIRGFFIVQLHSELPFKHLFCGKRRARLRQNSEMASRDVKAGEPGLPAVEAFDRFTPPPTVNICTGTLNIFNQKHLLLYFVKCKRMHLNVCVRAVVVYAQARVHLSVRVCGYGCCCGSRVNERRYCAMKANICFDKSPR